jgi:ABC-type transport system involved in multi-copper enzyme maturation permease subunit
VLLAKPVPRWCLLVGKYLGVVLFVAFQASVFFVGTWLALGVRTGYWPQGYFWAIPVLVLHFALVYSFSAFLAVWTRSTPASLFGGVLFWLLCFGINFSRHATAAQTGNDGAESPALFRSLVEACYWMLPKPADMMMLLDKAIGAEEHFASPDVFDAVVRAGAFLPELSLLTSCLFAFAMFAVAAQKLSTTDY